MASLYVYKCNSNDEDNQGDWNHFFDRQKGRGRWGGTWCIRNPCSAKILRERLQVGDYILAWQTNERAAYGICLVERLPVKGNEITIHLKLIERFDPPVRLLSHKKTVPALANGSAFVQGKLGTLFDTASDEAASILELCNASKAVKRRFKREL